MKLNTVFCTKSLFCGTERRRWSRKEIKRAAPQWIEWTNLNSKSAIFEAQNLMKRSRSSRLQRNKMGQAHAVLLIHRYILWHCEDKRLELYCLYCVKIFLVTLYILIKCVDSIVNSRVKIKHNDQGFTKRFFDEKKYNIINENSVGQTCTGLVHFM